jgi:hypothetical protein
MLEHEDFKRPRWEVLEIFNGYDGELSALPGRNRGKELGDFLVD